MAFDFSVEPEFEKKLEWIREFVREEVEPLEVIFPSCEFLPLVEERRRIVDALAAIPAEQRQPIEMAYFEGYTQQEISDRLKEPLGTVKTRMRLGMQQLKGLLDDSH